MAVTLSVAKGEAQSPDGAGVQRDFPLPEEGRSGSLEASDFTGPILPPGHWAVEALEKSSALLLLPTWLPEQRALSLESVEAGLREAVLAAEGRNPALLPLAASWYARLLEEFPGLAGPDDEGWRLIEHRAGIAFVASEGAAAPGLGEVGTERTGALPLPDRRAPVASAELAASWSRHLSFAAALEVEPDEVGLIRMEVAAGAGRWRAAVGRSEVGYGHGASGGIALTGDVPIDAFQVGTREAIELSGILSPLGRATLHTFLGRLGGDRHPDALYFWGASVRVQPTRRLVLGVNRAAMFGGDEAVTPGRVVSMLIGRVKGLGFENQIVTVSGKLVLPTESVIPTVLHAEWGAEDAAGSWWSVPGFVGGVTVPAFPGTPGLALTGEYAHFGTSCCGNPPWYRHWSFPGAWAAGDRTLGHPLGGNGSQVMVSGTVDLPAGRVKAQLFRRDRGVENLFAPERIGVSQGVGSSLELSPRDGWRLRIDADHEKGSSWSESELRIGIEHF